MLTNTSEVSPFNGCEFSIFHAKSGVTDAQLMAACSKMKEEFLQGEKGFVSHALLKGEDGAWADVVFTHTKEDAERICRNFMGNPACLDYLELIDERSVKLTFWARIQ